LHFLRDNVKCIVEVEEEEEEEERGLVPKCVIAYSPINYPTQLLKVCSPAMTKPEDDDAGVSAVKIKSAAAFAGSHKSAVGGTWAKSRCTNRPLAAPNNTHAPLPLKRAISRE